ncbi:MAG TPA: glutamine synthetase family protein [Methylophilaceae bacterium]|mgnify:FL=1|nr:glutamine synthetase family protein [Methylophilaceae bacterium]HQC28711.1 glutamine synthetase family protein [Methylotenera sp.]HQO16651.1 glutamine synthetase family protein [Methylotenera sp.]
MTEAIAKNHIDMDKWLTDNNITEVECLVPDLTGVARGKILPREKFSTDRAMRLPEAVFGMTVTGESPEDHEGYDRVFGFTDKDMVLIPDPSTLRVVPWAQDPTAQVIMDCFDHQGKPINFSPRNVLRRVANLYKELGFTPIVAPELEFYLLERNTDPDVALSPPVGRSGRKETSRQLYSIDAVNEFDPLFEDIYDYCDLMGLELDTLIHEFGAGQMEINFLHDEPMVLADKTFFFKRTLREVAMRHGMYATFMAKPMQNEPGSAMHIHQSVIDSKTGKNIFSKPDGTESPIFFNYIAGLQKYLPAAMVLLAPYVNSYRRIVRNGAAPINIEWGYDNRTVGIRVPISEPSARRVENRVVGADANPYLAMAVTLACGYLGIKEKLQPTAETTGSAYALDYQLPRGLSEAIRELEDATALHEVLGKDFVDVYLAVKDAEHDEFMRVISPWEREHLLMHV